LKISKFTEMGLPKGRTNNPAGKPKGTTTKITSTIRDRIGNFIDDNFEAFIEDVHQLEPKDRVKAFMELLQYSTPKFQAQAIKIESLSDELLDYLIKEVKGDENF
jgi:hypothetical protein